MLDGIATIRIADLLREISPEAPCGVNLEYDSAFRKLEQAAAAKPETQIGNQITPATPPDWKMVRELALNLLERSRDLRVAAWLARSSLRLHGLCAFTDGLALIGGLLEERWDHVFPLLDADDSNNPTERINALAMLYDSSGKSVAIPAPIVRDLREAWLICSPKLGRYTMRDIDLARGELSPVEGETPATLSVLVAALQDSDPETAATTLAALEQAHATVRQIELVITSKVGVQQAPSLASLATQLSRARDFLKNHGGAAAEAPAAAQTGEGGRSVAANTANTASTAISGEITCRADVVRTLEKICQYYAKHEPSSPVPLLLQRAQRLVDKSFMEIMEDMAPDGLSQIHTIRGKSDDDS